MRAALAMLTVSLLVCLGCDDAKAPAAARATRQLALPPDPAPPAATKPAPEAQPTDTTQPVEVTSQVADPTQAAAPAPNPNQQVQNVQPGGTKIMTAGVGAGVKGSDLGEGYVSTLARSYFRTGERINYFEIKKQFDIWKEINQRNPRTAEEYQKEILDPLSITLPDLYPGEEYVYDPKSGELFVWAPSQPAPQK